MTIIPSRRLMQPARITSSAKAAFAAAAAILCMGIPTGVAAKPLAAPGRTPAKAIAVISISDPAGLWRSLAASPAFGPLQRIIEKSLFKDGVSWATFEQDRPDIEDALGMSLQPPALFEEGIRGIDLYISEHSDPNHAPYETVVINFESEGQARRVLDLILKEAKSSTGLADGQRAGTVSESKQDDQIVYSMRGLKTHIATVGTVFAISSEEEGAWSILDGKATVPLFETDAYRRAVGALDPLPGQMWMFGDSDAVARLFTKTLALPDLGKTAEGVPTPKVGMVVEVRPDYIKLTEFKAPTEQTPYEQSRTAATRPENTGFKTAALLPTDATFTSLNNNFEGPSMVYAARETAIRQSGGRLTEERFQEGLENVDTMLGFSVENDFLASLGADTAFSFSKLRVGSPDGTGAPMFDADMLFVSTLSDSARMETVMTQLKVELDKQSQMFVSAASSDPSAPAGDAVASVFLEEAAGDTTMHTVDMKRLFPMASGLSPTYAITPDGMYVVGLKKETVSAALDRKRVADGSFFKSERIARAEQLLAPNRNTMNVINLREAGDMAGALMSLGAADLSVRDREEFGMLVDLARSLGTFYQCSTFTPEGMTNEYVASMK